MLTLEVVQTLDQTSAFVDIGVLEYLFGNPIPQPSAQVTPQVQVCVTYAMAVQRHKVKHSNNMGASPTKWTFVMDATKQRPGRSALLVLQPLFEHLVSDQLAKRTQLVLMGGIRHMESQAKEQLARTGCDLQVNLLQEGTYKLEKAHAKWEGDHGMLSYPGSLANGECLLVRSAVVDKVSRDYFMSFNLGLALATRIEYSGYEGYTIADGGYVVCQVCYPPFEPLEAQDVNTLVGQIRQDKECGFICVWPSSTQGFANRINTIASATTLAHAAGCSLLIVWEPTTACPVEHDRVLQLPNMDHTNIPKIKIVNKRQFEDEHWDRRILKPKLKTWSQEQHVSQFVHQNMQAIRTELKLSVVSERPGPDKKALLQFADRIQWAAHDYWYGMHHQVLIDGCRISGSILGIHIRRTDMQQLMLHKNHRTIDDYDQLDNNLLDMMEEHMRENPSGAIYIATDEESYFNWLRYKQHPSLSLRIFFGPHHHHAWLHEPLDQVPHIGNEPPLRGTSVPDFAVELLLLTKCHKLLLSKESTVTSLIRSLVPDTPCECIGTMQPSAHLHLLPGTKFEYTNFFRRNKLVLNYENRITQPWLNLNTQLWGCLLEIPIRDLLVFHEKVLNLCIAKGDGANKMETRLLGQVPETPQAIDAAKVKYYAVYDPMIKQFESHKKPHGSYSENSSGVSQEASTTKPAKFWHALFWTRLLQLSRQLSLPMFIHDGQHLHLVKTDACIQALQSTCSGRNSAVRIVQSAWAQIVCAKLTTEEVTHCALASQQQLDSWTAEQGEGEDDASILDNEFCLNYEEAMNAPTTPPFPEPAQENSSSEDNWQDQNNWECQKRQRRC